MRLIFRSYLLVDMHTQCAKHTNSKHKSINHGKGRDWGRVRPISAGKTDLSRQAARVPIF